MITSDHPRGRFKAGHASRRLTRQASEKWRPSVGLVIFTVLARWPHSFVGLFFFRLYDNQLIHQTKRD